MKTNLVCVDKGEAAITDDNLKYIFVTKFDDDAVSKFFTNFIKMEADPDYKVIPIVISSFGGQVHSLLPMLDLIKASTKPVSTIALGKAMSCGAILLAAGTKGYRYSSPSTDIMLHEVSSVEWGKNTELQNGIKQTTRLNRYLFDFLTAQSNMKDRKYFFKKMKGMSNVDWYLSPKEYKNLGLIDHVEVPRLIVK